MSLSTALKNSVLLLLIILILHFLLKNALVDASRAVQSYKNSTPYDDEPEEELAEAFQSELTHVEQQPNLNPKTCNMSDIEPTPVKRCKDGAEQDNDLFEYVFGDTHDDKIRPAKLDKDVCSALTGNEASTPVVSKKSARDTKSGHGDVMGNLIVGDYKDEKGLNGGEVFDGLYGFDGNSSTFEEL
jgi:hypothetical protein